MQFTLSRLLASTSLIAFGIAGATLPFRINEEDWIGYSPMLKAFLLLHCWTSGAVIGGAFGAVVSHVDVTRHAAGRQP